MAAAGWLQRAAAGGGAGAVGAERRGVPRGVRDGVAGDAAAGPGDAAGGGLGWGQVLMAANTPVLLRAAMVDGRTDLGLMSSGQVAGLIGDLPSCADLIEAIMAEAGRTLDRLRRVR